MSVVEILADREHARWAKWQAYLHGKCNRNPDGSLTIPADLVERWQRQIYTPYSYLTEREKESDRIEARDILRTLVAALGVKAAERGARTMRAFQERVSAWLLTCFSRTLAMTKKERAQRFLEEALELVQAEGLTWKDCDLMVNYVFGRPAGETRQEVGGVAVTLAALCWNAEVDLEDAAFAEIERIEHPDMIDKIRRKQASKSAILGITADPTESARAAGGAS